MVLTAVLSMAALEAETKIPYKCEFMHVFKILCPHRMIPGNFVSGL